MQRFETLEIWQDAVNYGVLIYEVTQAFPKEELFALTNQLRRAAVSISSNIAEGSGASTVKDFQKFLDIAIKSTLETISQVKFATRLQYLLVEKSDKVTDQATVLIKRITAFKNALNRKP